MQSTDGKVDPNKKHHESNFVNLNEVLIEEGLLKKSNDGSFIENHATISEDDQTSNAFRMSQDSFKGPQRMNPAATKIIEERELNRQIEINYRINHKHQEIEKLLTSEELARRQSVRSKHQTLFKEREQIIDKTLFQLPFAHPQDMKLYYRKYGLNL